MMQDRKTLKERAKELMRTEIPAPWLVTLVYLIATSWLATLSEAFNPVAQELNTLSTVLQTASLERDEGAMASALFSLQQLTQRPAFFVTVLVSVLVTLYAIVVQYGYYSYSLRLVRETEGGVGELFSRFYMAGRVILAELLMALFIALWSMLFVIPGIVAIYRYRMIPYLLLDEPDLSIWQAFRRSKELMNGRKMELLVLDLSFLPWLLGAMLLSEMAAGFASGVLQVILVLAVSTACNLYIFPYQQFTYAQWYDALRQSEVTDGAQAPLY